MTHPTALPALADPDRYVACRWDLTRAADQRRYWVDLFRNHFPGLLDRALEVAAAEGEDAGEARARADAARGDFDTFLDAAAAEPQRFGRLDILAICDERERVLRRHRFADPYRLAKSRENELALTVLPQVLAELDAMADDQRRVELIRGVFAGNIFDLGAVATNAMFSGSQKVDFHATRRKLKPRPWLIDNLDAWLARFDRPVWPAALLFVDNAGPDIVLGMIPFARDLALRGTRVYLAANTTPSLNDVTAEELESLLARVEQLDPETRSLRAAGNLAVLADGNGAPLIDLTRLDPAFVRRVSAGPDVGLVVLEGMGRAIESNLDARFRCDVLKIAMIKDEGVAEALGGSLYDLVLRFEAALETSE